MNKQLSTLGILALLTALITTACGPKPTPVPPATPVPIPSREEGTPSGGANQAPDPDRARDVALAYLAETYGDQAPPAGLNWSGVNTTDQQIVGSATLQYTADDWLITVSFPIVLPEDTIFTIEVSNETSGFQWTGEVDAQAQVTEKAKPGAEAGGPSEASAADLDTQVEGNSAFALDLYQVLKANEGNLFLSPYSISLALAMTYAGARGETEAQMAAALHYLLPQAQLHPAFHALDQALASRGQGAAGKDGQGFRLHIANALWGQEDEEFLPDFVSIAEQYYDAGLHLVDYAGAPDKARQTINRWISQQTEGRIKDLIPPEAVNAAVRLILTNAIYFNAAWAEQFDEGGTSDGPFYRLDGSQATVPLMAQSQHFPYAQGQGYQALELPYDGYELAMVILLPEEGEFAGFEDSLDAERLGAILAALDSRQVAVTLPRFEFESKFSLNETLQALGMVNAFSTAADFSGMTPGGGLFISDVIHQAFVAVDEAGTEAAAATAVIMPKSAAPEEPIEFTANRPFLFLSRDLESGAILFLGRVLDPSA